MKKVVIIITTVILIAVIVLGIVLLNKKAKRQDMLTLDTVKILADTKGDSLSWEDFSKYPSQEIGSGLYILLYDIDEIYSLRIGGVPNEKPMYIQLVSKKDDAKTIDIRYDNITEFLQEMK